MGTESNHHENMKPRDKTINQPVKFLGNQSNKHWHSTFSHGLDWKLKLAGI